MKFGQNSVKWWHACVIMASLDNHKGESLQAASMAKKEKYLIGQKQDSD